MGPDGRIRSQPELGEIVGATSLSCAGEGPVPPALTQRSARQPFVVGASSHCFHCLVQPFSMLSSGFCKEGGAYLWSEPEGCLGTTESPHPFIYR